MDSFTPVVHDSFRRSISKNPHLLLDENSVKIFGGNAMDVLNRGGMRKRVSPGGGMAECATLEKTPLKLISLVLISPNFFHPRFDTPEGITPHEFLP